MAGNLTRDEARERARLLSVQSYAVELDLTEGEERFESVTTVRFTSTRAGAETFIDLAGAKVRKAVLNGAELDVSTYDLETGRLPLPGLAESNELQIDADCSYMRTGEGLHRFVDPVDKSVYLHSQFETADAHRMYACFDQPDLKATFELTVLAPSHWEVISNAAPDEIEDLPEHRGRHGALQASKRWHFPPTPVMSTYITALCAGPYHKVTSEHDGIPLGLYCRASLAEHLDADNIFEVTRQGFDFFHKVFGLRYPFGKYDQLFVPEFNAGAMENAGCVTFLEDYVFRSRVTDAVIERRAETILHEMAHMWFGDLVTMRWWDDLWLNESFATYASVLCQAEATRWGQGAWTTFANVEKAWAYRQDQLPSTHPIAADIVDMHAVEVNFDGITYAKGASVLKQLVAYVGLDNFLAGVRDYFNEHAWGNTELSDLLRALERTSGRNLSEWSKEWLETSWVNTLRPAFEVDEAGRFTSFEVLQEAPADYPTLRSHRVAIGLYSHSGDALVRVKRVELDVVGARTAVAELVGEVQPDLVLINDDDLTYAKVRLDDRSLRTLVSGGIAKFAGPSGSLPRALCWSAAWDMTRDAEMATRDYVALVTSGIASVEDITVAQTVLRQARLAVQQYADPAWRAEGLSLLASALRSLVAAAEPGSDHQLAYVNALAATAVSADDMAFLSGLLDGTTVLAGLTVDTDLRWTLTQALVSGGVLGDADIAEELLRDPTATGERAAALARAALPTAEGKAGAWNAITEGGLSGALLRSTIGGFMDPRHPELLEPYADRYFAEIGRIWKSWTSDSAQNFANGCYPALAVSPETVARTERLIEESNPPHALRRLLLEGADGVRRALRAQARDASA
ncbi:aminopeptidase N [Planomonospora parontospora]|uniref:aminopeptidase N n=1 Tax=Planomonospora parontospora TaxID=58119 RepID=UPI001670D005|nr:aminopeptidase N [Planomonospora parontospora]GGL43977.1 aminopeptidase N [Planomonospora parontospora subsp. antibiotica]GII18569.1 aminopeptidase N [Planomonospora parontospora subsp. antibiotica]